MFRYSMAAVACALALSASASMAASQSSAAISGLSFTLIDLNTRDGIDASFSFLNAGGSTVLSVSATDSALGENESASRTRAGTFSFTKEYLAELANSNAKASIGTQSLSASGAAGGLQTSYNATASTGANINSYYNQVLNLSLSANSLLLVNADVSLSASATNPGACTYYYYCNSSESASATASLYLSYNYGMQGGSASYNTLQTSSLQATAQGGTSYWNNVYNPETGWYDYVLVTTPGTEETKSLLDVLTGVFTNSSAQTQLASLGLSVAVSGQANTAPAVLLAGPIGVTAVPEPQSYLLLLAGLGTVGFLARRRRQN